MNVAAPILDLLAAEPARPGVREPSGRSATYGELRQRIVALGRELQRRGLRPGDRVVLQVPAGVDFAASAVAVLLVGGVPVLCEPGLGDAVYRSRIRAAEARWLVVHPLVQRLGRVPGARGLLRRLELDVPPVPDLDDVPGRVLLAPRWLDGLAAALPAQADLTPVDRSGEDDGVLVFTGGTTSEPKGVRLSNRALQSYLTNIHSVIADLRIESLLADTPQQVLYALWLGRTAFTTRGGRRRRAALVHRLVRSGAVDAYFGSPYVWVKMMAMTGPGRAPLPASLRTVLLGSAPVTPELLRQLRGWLHPDTRILSIYGLTEAGPVCVSRVDDKLAWEREGHDGDFVGFPLPGVRVTLDADAAPRVGADVGEVVVHSPSLYSGYLGQPPLGAEDGLHTGDLGRLVTRGDREALVLLGRTKDMIIRRGVNIYPGTLEPTLRALGDEHGLMFGDVALVGTWNPKTQDEELVLCVSPAPDRQAPLDPEDVKRRAASVTGTDGAPDHVLVKQELPVTGRQNKVDKAALRRVAAQRLGGAPAPASLRCRAITPWSPGSRAHGSPLAGSASTASTGSCSRQRAPPAPC